MPRGVVIPEIRQQLFAAVERVIARDGSGKVSGRAITVEAGVATGLLYTHFSDLDAFLTAYAVDRSFAISATSATLAEEAGLGDVAGNITAALLATPLVTIRTLTRLLAARPELIDQVQDILGPNTAGLGAIRPAVVGYWIEEQRLGRINAQDDPEALALAVVGALHHLVLGDATERSIRADLTRTVAALSLRSRTDQFEGVRKAGKGT